MQRSGFFLKPQFINHSLSKTLQPAFTHRFNVSKSLFSTADSQKKVVSFIGGGRMAECIIGRTLPQHDVVVLEANDERRAYLDTTFTKVETAKSFGSLSYDQIFDSSSGKSFLNSDLLILAIKPQNIPQFFKTLRERDILQSLKANKDLCILSVCAGVSLKQLQEGFESDNLIRAMPNTPAIVGHGLTVWHPSANFKAQDNLKLAQSVLQSMGKEIKVSEEEHIDMATAISGCGPAYVFLFIESLIESAVHLGLSRETAMEMVKQTLRGSLEYFDQSSKHPVLLRNDITSPGGATAAASYQLEQGGFRTVLGDAIWAAYQRSRELGGKSHEVGPPTIR